MTHKCHVTVDGHVDNWPQFPDWIGDIGLESCSQSQRPVSAAAGLCGDGGAGPLHLWPDVQRAEAARPGPLQVGAFTHTSLFSLLLDFWVNSLINSLNRSHHYGSSWRLSWEIFFFPCFRDAVDAVGGVCCSRPVTQELRTLAVSAFGDPSGWDEAQVYALGNIIGNVTFYFAYISGNEPRFEKKLTCLLASSISWIGHLSAGLFSPFGLPSYTQELHPTLTARKLSCKSLPPPFHHVFSCKTR